MFLTNKEIPKAIKSAIAKAKTIDLAVAYWGAGGTDELGLRKSQRRKLRIICDLLSGSTNPDEIVKLRKNFALPQNVRHITGLHAKVYLTDTTCIVGSSNASTNGLGNEGSDLGLVEAAFRSDLQNDVSAAASWFDEQWKRAKPVTKTDIKEAMVAWNLRKGTRPAISLRRGHRGTKTLFGLEQQNLAGRNIYLVIYQEGFSRDGQSTFDSTLKEKKSLRDFHGYEECAPEGNKTWVPLNSYIIDCRVYRNSGRIVINGEFLKTVDKYQCEPIPYEDGTVGYLVFVQPPNKISFLGGRKNSISSSDKKKIAEAIRKIPGYKTRNITIPIEKLKL